MQRLRSKFCRAACLVCRAACLATILLSPLLPGCAAWDMQRWDLDNLRDERAVDLEQRLNSSEPIVANPF